MLKLPTAITCCSLTTCIVATLIFGAPLAAQSTPSESNAEATFQIPKRWVYSSPLVAPEDRSHERSAAQKDPTVVFHDGRWHLFMTVKLSGRSAIEYCSFESWNDANASKRVLLPLSDSDYFCAPQVFYFSPHKKWYLIYQVGVKNSRKMWVAYSTTENIDAPDSWTPARPMLDGGPGDPRKKGGLDYWIICDDETAYLFLTSLDGTMWRLSTKLQDFPNGFANCEIALRGKFLEASHTYRLKDQNKYLTILEVDGKRYFKAYLADRLDGPWTPIADSPESPFASWHNISPDKGVQPWTDNVSHGELVRHSNDQTLTTDPDRLQFVFQGLLEKQKKGSGYGKFPWRIGILTPAD